MEAQKWTSFCPDFPNDGSSVISNSEIDGVSESSLRVTIYYNVLCIRVCAFYK